MLHLSLHFGRYQHAYSNKDGNVKTSYSPGCRYGTRNCNIPEHRVRYHHSKELGVNDHTLASAANNTPHTGRGKVSIERPQDQSRLLSLPTEILVYIYELVLQVKEDPVSAEKLPKQHLAILQTCQQILREAETMFYAMHRFRFGSGLFRIGELRRKAIKAITIVTSRGGEAHAALLGLYGFPNLRSLYIQRELSVRYLNVAEWAIMRRQMVSELDKLPALEEVKILTPASTSMLMESEKEREKKLAQVDAFLERDPLGKLLETSLQ